MKNRGFRTLDLFAGVGGIRLAFDNAGFKTVFANDSNRKCKETYDLNFKEPKLTVKDIWKIYVKDLPYFDVLIAGFPCQAFSIAGKQNGFKDKENGGNLFFSIARVLGIKKPPAFMLENVKNLENHNKGNTFKVIKNILEKRLKYYIKTKVLNSTTHGNLPQNRERIFIVGFKDKKKTEAFEFPKEIELTKSFKEYTSGKVDDKYYYNNKPLYNKIKDDINSEDTVYQWRRKYVRANKKGVVPTLTANMGTGGHNVPIIKNHKGIRKLTPKECFMLQGFPKNFELPKIADSYLYHQAGNSVSVIVVERVAKNIKKVLEGSKNNSNM